MALPLVPPHELRSAIAADLRPVRPLPSPILRALVVAGWIPAAVALVLALLGLRRDLALLGWPMAVGQLALEAALGLVLVALALAEAVPARGVAHAHAAAALGLAAAAFVVQAAVARSASAGVAVPNPFVSHGPPCFALQVLVGLPALAVVAVLVVRAAPLRAVWAGVLGGAGVGLIADGIYRLHCPVTDLRHVLLWHGAAVVLLALAGVAAGLVWERAERERFGVRPASRGRLS